MCWASQRLEFLERTGLADLKQVLPDPGRWPEVEQGRGARVLKPSVDVSRVTVQSERRLPQSKGPVFGDWALAGKRVHLQEEGEIVERLDVLEIPRAEVVGRERVHR